MAFTKPEDIEHIDDLNLLSVKEIARRLGIAKSTVYRKVNEGDLPSIKFSEHRILICESDFIAWLHSKRNAGSIQD